MMQTNRQKSCWCVEHWILRGYTEEQAKIEISKRQSRGRSHFKTEEDYLNFRNKVKIGQSTPEFIAAKSKRMKKIWTDAHWIKKFGKIEGLKKFQIWKQKRIDGTKRVHSELTKEDYQKRSHYSKVFWINKGLTEEEAEKRVAADQSRGKAFFIAKHGKVAGIKRWKLRTKNWRKSFDDNNDRLEVNKKRQENAHIGYYTEKLIESHKIINLNFYLLKFDVDGEKFIKYGITKQPTPIKRWGTAKKNNYEVIQFKSMPAKNALQLEQKIKTEFKKYSYVPKCIKTLEALTLDSQPELTKLLESTK